MTKPNLKDSAALAEIIGTVGLIVSLLFVAYSINRNTEEVQASHSTNIYDATREVELAVASDVDWSRIVVQGKNRAKSLSNADQFRYDTYLVLMLDNWDQLVSRYGAGFLDENVFIGWNEYFEAWTKRHVTSREWKRISWQYDDAIRSRVEAIIEPISSE